MVQDTGVRPPDQLRTNTCVSPTTRMPPGPGLPCPRGGVGWLAARLKEQLAGGGRPYLLLQVEPLRVCGRAVRPGGDVCVQQQQEAAVWKGVHFRSGSSTSWEPWTALRPSARLTRVGAELRGQRLVVRQEGQQLHRQQHAGQGHVGTEAPWQQREHTLEPGTQADMDACPTPPLPHFSPEGQGTRPRRPDSEASRPPPSTGERALPAPDGCG